MNFKAILLLLLIGYAATLDFADENEERISKDGKNDDDNDDDDDVAVEDLKNDENEADDDDDDYPDDDSNSDATNDDDRSDELIQEKRAIPSLTTTAAAFNSNFLSIGRRQPGAVMPPEVDLMLILHASKHTTQANVDLAVKFFKDILKHFSISPSTTRVAAVSYADFAYEDFDFNDHVNRKCVNKALNQITAKTGGATGTRRALWKARSIYTSSTKGARPNARNVVLLLIDSPSLWSPTNAAQRLKNSPVNAEIFVLGIGSTLTDSELENIATSNSHVFRVNTFADLQEIVNRLDATNTYKYCRMLRPIGGQIGRVDRLGRLTTNRLIQPRYHDECHRRCECRNNKLVNCCRVRKEFTSMSAVERERYVNAVLVASTTEPFRTDYRKVVKKHRRYFNFGIHRQREFLPWHRLFILDYENILRQVDCRVTVPYWDWALWSHDPWSTVLPGVWHSSMQGLGGNSVPGHSCLTDGPFRSPGWQMTNGGCLRRAFTGSATPDAAQVQFCLSHSQFADFEVFLRVALHNSVHCLISGTMCLGFDSAEAPEFYLHHGFIDKIWADWQKKSTQNFNAFFPNVVRKLIGYSDYKPGDLIDLQNQPFCVKVCYDEPTVNNANAVRSALNRMTASQISHLRRLPFPSISKRSMDLFKVSRAERAKATRMFRAATKGFTKNLSLRCTDRITGFNTGAFKAGAKCPRISG